MSLCIFHNQHLTWRHVFRDVKWICDTGKLGRVVIDVLHGDVQPHVWRLFSVICTHQEGVFWTPLPVQLLCGDQITRFRINAEAVICPTDDGVCDKGVGTLRWRREMNISETKGLGSTGDVYFAELWVPRPQWKKNIMITSIKATVAGRKSDCLPHVNVSRLQIKQPNCLSWMKPFRVTSSQGYNIKERLVGPKNVEHIKRKKIGRVTAWPA